MMPVRYFLRTPQQYENAPVGTEVGPMSSTRWVRRSGRFGIRSDLEMRVWPEVRYRVFKASDGRWYSDKPQDEPRGRASIENVAREVILWGDR